MALAPSPPPPFLTASRTPQPGSCKCVQLENLQWPACAAMSGMQAASCIGAMCCRTNSWKPGESISALVRASSIQYQWVLVVVCRPEFSAWDSAPVSTAAPGTSRLISVLLPHPDAPTNGVLLPGPEGPSTSVVLAVSCCSSAARSTALDRASDKGSTP